MKNLMINDLPMSKELDRKALSTIAGGKVGVKLIFKVEVEVNKSKVQSRRLRYTRFVRPQSGFLVM